MRSALMPEHAVGWLRGDARPFALVGDWLAGGALFGSEPLRVAAADDDPLALLEALPEVGEGEATVGGGWVGWLGYGVGARIERLPPSPPAPIVRPPFSLAFYDHVVRFDGDRWWFEALWSAERDDTLRRRLAIWEQRLGTGLAPSRPARTTTPFVLAGNGAPGHVAAVADARRRIAEGEVLQANLCLRLEAELGTEKCTTVPGES